MAYDLQIEWAVIKAVSDLADGSKEKTEPWQPFSSVMAVSVVHNIFHPAVLRSWPHHGRAPGNHPNLDWYGFEIP